MKDILVGLHPHHIAPLLSLVRGHKAHGPRLEADLWREIEYRIEQAKERGGSAGVAVKHVRHGDFIDATGIVDELPNKPEPWKNRMRWLGGVNQNCRWQGECRCGFLVIDGFDTVDKRLREHIAACDGSPKAAT